jgi:hypothetical protein
MMVSADNVVLLVRNANVLPASTLLSKYTSLNAAVIKPDLLITAL